MTTFNAVPAGKLNKAIDGILAKGNTYAEGLHVVCWQVCEHGNAHGNTGPAQRLYDGIMSKLKGIVRVWLCTFGPFKWNAAESKIEYAKRKGFDAAKAMLPENSPMNWNKPNKGQSGPRSELSILKACLTALEKAKAESGFVAVSTIEHIKAEVALAEKRAEQVARTEKLEKGQPVAAKANSSKPETKAKAEGQSKRAATRAKADSKAKAKAKAKTKAKAKDVQNVIKLATTKSAA